MTDFRIKATKIARKLEVSMYMCTEKLIEIAEQDRKKREEFTREIEKINSTTRVTDLILNNQHEDSKGNSIIGSKSLYLVDDEYYRKLVGEDPQQKFTENIKVMKEKQLSLF